MHFNLYFYFIFYKYNQYAFYHDILSSIVISKVSLLMSSSRNHLITWQRVSMAKPFRIWKLSLLMRSRRNHRSDHLPAIPEIVGGEIKIEEKEPSDYPAMGTKNSVHDQKKQKYPENYRTCVNFLQLFWTAVSVGM